MSVCAYARLFESLEHFSGSSVGCNIATYVREVESRVCSQPGQTCWEDEASSHCYSTSISSRRGLTRANVTTNQITCLSQVNIRAFLKPRYRVAAAGIPLKMQRRRGSLISFSLRTRIITIIAMLENHTQSDPANEHHAKPCAYSDRPYRKDCKTPPPTSEVGMTGPEYARARCHPRNTG